MILHMDDESANLRNIVLGCLITLPTSLDFLVMEEVKKVEMKHVHQDPIQKLGEKFRAFSV